MDSIVGISTVSLLLALALLTGCNTQYRMLYCPSSSPPSEGSIAGTGLCFWPSSGKGYRGFIGGVETGASKGTFVVFHGNGGTASDRDFYVKSLAGLGYRVILAEYPRYGGRPGELGEAAFVRDGLETVRLAAEMYGGPVYLLGESLGCGVAAAVAASTPVPVAGIVLITPWDTLGSAARSHFPAILVRLLLKDTYDNTANLARFRGRIAVIGAERDNVIPMRHASNLYASLPSRSKRMWVIERAGHNDWPMYVDQGWWKEITDFVGGAAVEGSGKVNP
jgi:pimeloyl-ACP methyl ester carboxylesterase